MLKIIALCASICFTASNANVLSAWLESYSANPQEQAGKDYQNDLMFIDQMSSNRDYPGLVAFSLKIEEKWAPKDLGRYATLVLRTASAMHNASDQPIEIRYRDAQKIVLRALEKFDRLPIEAIAKLLPYIRDEPVDERNTDAGKRWEKQRTLNATLWLRAWQRLEAETDKNFNPDDVPMMNVSPPKETRLPPGVSPDSISNPQLRQQYERAIARNRQKAEAYSHQHRLRQIMEWFPQKTQIFLINSYSTPPANDAELHVLLERYVSEKSIGDNILRGVVEKRTSK